MAVTSCYGCGSYVTVGIGAAVCELTCMRARTFRTPAPAFTRVGTECCHTG